MTTVNCCCVYEKAVKLVAEKEKKSYLCHVLRKIYVHYFLCHVKCVQRTYNLMKSLGLRSMYSVECLRLNRRIFVFLACFYSHSRKILSPSNSVLK